MDMKINRGVVALRWGENPFFKSLGSQVHLDSFHALKEDFTLLQVEPPFCFQKTSCKVVAEIWKI